MRRNALVGINATVNDNAEVGDQVRLYNGGTLLFSVTLRADDLLNRGTEQAPRYHIDLQLPSSIPLADGTYNLSATVFDAAGNESARSPVTQNIVIDTTGPAAPGSVVLTSTSDSGTLNSDRITRTSTGLVITGTVPTRPPAYACCRPTIAACSAATV